MAAGTRSRLAPQASLTTGPVSAYAEWVLSTQEVARADEEASITAGAWQVAATAVLTGEDATLGRMRPARPLGEGGIGAFELAARYHAFSLDNDAFPFFVDPSSNARSASSITVGVNWYLTQFARVTVNAERTAFGAPDGFDDPPAEVVFLGRMQLSI
jgi:phosphate-selective porin OprO/OprP